MVRCCQRDKRLGKIVIHLHQYKERWWIMVSSRQKLNETSIPDQGKSLEWWTPIRQRAATFILIKWNNRPIKKKELKCCNQTTMIQIKTTGINSRRNYSLRTSAETKSITHHSMLREWCNRRQQITLTEENIIYRNLPINSPTSNRKI